MRTYSSSTSQVRRFIISRSLGSEEQVGVFIDSNSEGARRFCYYLYRRGIGAKYMASSLIEGYEWFTYATCKGLNKEQVVNKILPACKRKTNDIKVLDSIEDSYEVKISGMVWENRKKGICIECQNYTDVDNRWSDFEEDEGICYPCSHL